VPRGDPHLVLAGNYANPLITWTASFFAGQTGNVVLQWNNEGVWLTSDSILEASLETILQPVTLLPNDPGLYRAVIEVTGGETYYSPEVNLA
jgi:hypothetical protein